MDIHPATSQAGADRAPHGGAPGNRAQSGLVMRMLLVLLGILCRHLNFFVPAPRTGWTLPLLLHVIAGLLTALRPRRRRTPGVRPFIPRRLRRGSPELLVVDAYRLPPRDPARPLRRLPPRPRQGRGPPARARIP
jgi:hypothetical protein